MTVGGAAHYPHPIQAAIFVCSDNPSVPQQHKIVSLIAWQSSDELRKFALSDGTSVQVSETWKFREWRDAALFLAPIHGQLDASLPAIVDALPPDGMKSEHFLAAPDFDLSAVLNFLSRKRRGRRAISAKPPPFLRNGFARLPPVPPDLWVRCCSADELFACDISNVMFQGKPWSPLRSARSAGVDDDVRAIIWIFEILSRHNAWGLSDQQLLGMAWLLAMDAEIVGKERAPKRLRLRVLGGVSQFFPQEGTFEDVPDYVDELVTPNFELKRCLSIVTAMPTATFCFAAKCQLSEYSLELLEPYLRTVTGGRSDGIDVLSYHFTASEIIEACRRACADKALKGRPKSVGRHKLAVSIAKAYCALSEGHLHTADARGFGQEISRRLGLNLSFEEAFREVSKVRAASAVPLDLQFF